MRVVEEVIRFKQAGVDPDALLSLSEETGDGALKWKMHDLSLLYAAYEEALAGRFQDGEDEIREAMERLSSASSLRDASVFAFGFDLTTPIWNDFVTPACRVRPARGGVSSVGKRWKRARFHAVWAASGFL